MATLRTGPSPPSSSGVTTSCGACPCPGGSMHDPDLDLDPDLRSSQTLVPSWPDTAHDLTLWRRRKKASAVAPGGSGAAPDDGGGGAAPGALLASTSCSHCGKTQPLPLLSSADRGGGGGGHPGVGASVLRRCRLCREAQYCGPECCKAHRGGHERMHALRLILDQGSDGLAEWDGAGYEAFRPFVTR